MLAFDALAKNQNHSYGQLLLFSVEGERHLTGGVLDLKPQGSSKKGAGYLSLEMSSCLRKIKG